MAKMRGDKERHEDYKGGAKPGPHKVVPMKDLKPPFPAKEVPKKN